nr:N-acetylglucosamine-6-phosphate deacetylase [Alteromonas pelagimontana]
MRIKTKSLFDGATTQTNVVMHINDGVVSAMEKNGSHFDVELEGLCVPGFVDVQVNGGGGVLFNDAPTVASIAAITSAHARYGTTGMLPTIITDDILKMEVAADAVAQALRRRIPGVLGIHFEGPHIAQAKKGAHSAQFIRSLSSAELDIFTRKDIGRVVVTLAPECVSEADIKRLTDAGVIVSLGHTNASFDCAQRAFEAGATGITHLFNAMSALTSREPGVTGAALLSDKTLCGLILDGHHVSAKTCQLALRAKPAGGIFLVTDAMPPVGSSVDRFEFFDREVYLVDGELRSTTGELAGSALNMVGAVKNCIHLLDLSLEEAIRMASLYPLMFLAGKSQLPIKPEPLITVGAPASFVQLTANRDVASTWIDGHQIYAANAR